MECVTTYADIQRSGQLYGFVLDVAFMSFDYGISVFAFNLKIRDLSSGSLPLSNTPIRFSGRLIILIIIIPQVNALPRKATWPRKLTSLQTYHAVIWFEVL